MDKQPLSGSIKWPLPQWTSAPLQLEKVTLLPIVPATLFASLTEPEEMCRLFSWMHHITVDNKDALVPNGLGAKRRCHFGNGMVLEEVIVGWEPPLRYAYRGLDEMHPFGMIGHLGIIECQPVNGDTQLIWRHYFDHSNPTAMRKQLSASVQMALDSLYARFQHI